MADSTIVITMTVAEEFADVNHVTGVTSDGYDRIFDALGSFGYDIFIEKGTDQHG